MRIIYGFQLFNHTRVVPYFTLVYDYPRRYTAKQLKTIYYSLTLPGAVRKMARTVNGISLSICMVRNDKNNEIKPLTVSQLARFLSFSHSAYSFLSK